MALFNGLDHIAIVVRNTEAALTLYRDMLGFAVLFSEVLEEQGVRLTHLDLGNANLQLVEPLNTDHALSKFLDEHGEGLHHVCFSVASVPDSMAELPAHRLRSRDAAPRRGPVGRQAAFIDPQTTHSVLIEITSEPPIQAENHS